ncbi:DNA methyltransferase [Gordonia alkanivorans]|uniref:DNA methyltransferase n=1 Tax=Gordonia alkanivorans TaxID=84096 RepID=UPI001F4F0A0D|nr:DNA methyltransferase [Gordonia alkanivorans]
MDKNQLHYGDNLEVLQGGEIAPNSVDLVYLDPPFNSNRVYNVIFNKKGDAEAQVQAFDDTWTWTTATDEHYEYLISGGLPSKAADLLAAMRDLLGTSNLMAYLVVMTPRLVELHRVLKPTGSIYLHCDPTASHYLKIVMDSIFDQKNFKNEIIWRRTGAHSPRTSFGPIHDVILFYTKSPNYYFNVIRRPYSRNHVAARYRQQPDGQLKFTSGGNVLTGAGSGGGESSQPWKGFNPAAKNRHWAIPGFVSEQMPPEFANLSVLEKLDAAFEAGLIEIIPGRAWPEPVRYLRPGDGNPVGDIWCYEPGTEGVLHGTELAIDEDVAYLGPTSPERLGYPTQKPVGLLERIINASCPPGGVVLDPFCGCGTTLDAAINLNRRWIGIDVTYLSIDLIRNRLRETHGAAVDETYDVRGVPADLEGAHDLFNRSPFDFERWAVSLVRGTPNAKQVGDKGKDGVILFVTGKKTRAEAIVSVKGGKQLMPAMVRDLGGVVARRNKAEIGVLITLHTATKGMRQEAQTAGTYTDWVGNTYPKIQIYSVEELLKGAKPKTPPVVPPYTSAQKRVTTGVQLTFGMDDPEDLPVETDIIPENVAELD